MRTPSRFLGAILAASLACGCTVISHRTDVAPDGSVIGSIRVSRFLTNTRAGHVEFIDAAGANMTIEGYESRISEESVKAIAAGVTEAILKGLKPVSVP